MSGDFWVRCPLWFALACSAKPVEQAPARLPRDATTDVATDGIPDAARGPITFAFTGDLMLGSTYPSARLPSQNLFADVEPILQRADVTFGNLEGPLFDGGTRPTCTPGAIAEKNHGKPGTTCWAFRMPTRLGAQLRDAGYDVVSIANNHIDDFGAEGRASTITALDALAIAHSGPKGSIAKLDVRGRAVHVIAFAPYASLNDMNDPDAAKLVAASHAAGAVVVVSFHGGAEGVGAREVPDTRETFWGEDRGAVREFAHAMIDAGADIVVGHGPHVLRALERYKGHLIAYSLGTFASFGGISIDGVLGVTTILEVMLDETGFVATVVPILQRGDGPRRDPKRLAIAAMRELSTDVAEDGTFRSR